MSSRFNPVIVAVAIPLAAVVFAAGAVMFKRASGGGAEPFPRERYFENPASVLGGHYSLRAQVDSQLGFDATGGKLICVRPQSGGRLAIVVPVALAEKLSAGQRYDFDIRVLENGCMVVGGMEKY